MCYNYLNTQLQSFSIVVSLCWSLTCGEAQKINTRERKHSRHWYIASRSSDVTTTKQRHKVYEESRESYPTNIKIYQKTVLSLLKVSIMSEWKLVHNINKSREFNNHNLSSTRFSYYGYSNVYYMHRPI